MYIYFIFKFTKQLAFSSTVSIIYHCWSFAFIIEGAFRGKKNIHRHLPISLASMSLEQRWSTHGNPRRNMANWTHNLYGEATVPATWRKRWHHCAELQPVLIPSLSQIHRFWMNLHCKGLGVSFTWLEQIMWHDILSKGRKFPERWRPGFDWRATNMTFIQEPRVHIQVLCLNLAKVALCARTGFHKVQAIGRQL